jgi:hypothetical protein
MNVTEQAWIEYRLERWGRANRILVRTEDYEDEAEAALGRAYGNCILAEWARYGGPPPKGRDCSGEDPAENPIEQQTEMAVMQIAIENPDIAAALRARYCGRGRVGVERYEVFKVLAGDYSRATYFRAIQIGKDMAFRILKPLARAGAPMAMAS